MVDVQVEMDGWMADVQVEKIDEQFVDGEVWEVQFDTQFQVFDWVWPGSTIIHRKVWGWRDRDQQMVQEATFINAMYLV